MDIDKAMKNIESVLNKSSDAQGMNNCLYLLFLKERN